MNSPPSPDEGESRDCLGQRAASRPRRRLAAGQRAHTAVIVGWRTSNHSWMDSRQSNDPRNVSTSVMRSSLCLSRPLLSRSTLWRVSACAQVVSLWYWPADRALRGSRSGPDACRPRRSVPSMRLVCVRIEGERHGADPPLQNLHAPEGHIETRVIATAITARRPAKSASSLGTARAFVATARATWT